MIKERVIQVANYKGIKKETFFSRIGTTSANFRGKAKKTPLNSSTIENILSEFPDVNLEWLITGIGEMLKPESIKVYTNRNNPVKASGSSSTNDSRNVRLYDVNKITSLKSLFEGHDRFVIGEIRIPDIPACDGAIYIIGDNMYPLLKSGDIIVYKELADPNNIIFGEMYLISIKMEGEPYVTIRYINQSEQPGYYKLISHNPNYDPKEVLISSIDAVALIKVNIRKNTLF